MEILTSIDTSNVKPCVIALGNFDGVHLAHRMLLRKGKEIARKSNLDFCVLIFDPHPAKILYPGRHLQLIPTCLSKEEIFAQLGVDRIYRLPFTYEIAQMSGRDFVTDIILPLRGKEIVVGFNYTFGAKGTGNADYLIELGNEFGFGVNVLSPQVSDDGEIISSTSIRQALLDGRIEKAKKMLGSAPCLRGKVVQGEQRGRILGFPTANLEIDPDVLIPKRGVYAVYTQIGGDKIAGMMNIGMKPTFHQKYCQTVEVHLINYEGNLYGKELAVHIEKRLRDEMKFASVEELINQLVIDKINAESVINGSNNG